MDRDPFEPTRDPLRYGYQFSKDTRRRSLAVLFKRGWNEIPVVMAGGIAGIIGLCTISYALYVYERDEKWKKPYRRRYTVYRDTDPRVQDIKPFPMT